MRLSTHRNICLQNFRQFNHRTSRHIHFRMRLIQSCVIGFTHGARLRESAYRRPSTGHFGSLSTGYGRIVCHMEDGNMKTLITGSAATLALVLVAGPALTQPASAEAPNSVNVGGKYIGADPDSNVRFQMRRDVGSEGF